MKRSRMAFVATLLGGLLALTAALPAAAKPSSGGDVPPGQATAITPPAPAKIRVLTVPMVITGFDPEVAAAHGYEVRTNAAGQSVTVQAGEPTSAGTVIPNGTVGGTCGYSSVFLSNPWSLQYKIDTAFYTYSPSVAYGWHVLVTGPGYSRTHNWSGLLALAHAWTATATGNIALNQRGEFYAYASGQSTLWNGLICTSNHPTDIEGIF